MIVRGLLIESEGAFSIAEGPFTISRPLDLNNAGCLIEFAPLAIEIRGLEIKAGGYEIE